jgi:hypothetical protein
MNPANRKSLLLASVVSVLTLGSILIAASGSSVPSASLPIGMLKPLAEWTNDLVTIGGETPQGWQLGGKSDYKVLETPSQFFWFKNVAASKSGAKLSEEFVVYSAVLLAQQAFPTVLDGSFPPAYADKWKTMPELAVQSHADEARSACLSATVNGNSIQQCVVIARYQNVVVITRGNIFVDQWLTMSDFRQMLEAVDRRVASVLSR